RVDHRLSLVRRSRRAEVRKPKDPNSEARVLARQPNPRKPVIEASGVDNNLKVSHEVNPHSIRRAHGTRLDLARLQDDVSTRY
ncbi:hypothetical protein ACV334_37350, partial [Pseudomonas aeruginosa]